MAGKHARVVYDLDAELAELGELPTFPDCPIHGPGCEAWS